MSVENVLPDALLEREGYHLLPHSQLVGLDEPEAWQEHGKRLRNSIGVPEDAELGWKLTMKAAKAGHPIALADAFRFGRGVKKDDIRCYEIYCCSADRGHPVGTLLPHNFTCTHHVAGVFNKAWCLKHGIGTEKNEEEAIKLYHIAAEQNYSIAACNLGWCYKNGNGVEKNEREAIRLFRIAADQQHSSAQVELGVCYEHVRGCALCALTV
jgi:hypothetical protein